MNEVNIYNLKQGEIKNPVLVGVHGAGGMLFLGNLARHLSKRQKFLALQGKNLDQPKMEQCFADIKQLCTQYVNTIQNLIHRETVYICGRFGPVVLETGQQLLERNIDVGALIVFDNVAPWVSDAPENNLSRRLIIDPLRGVLGISDNIGLKDWLYQKFVSTSAQIPRENPFMAMNGYLIRDYSAKHFDGKVILIRSEDFTHRPSKDRHLESWRRVTDHFETFTVPGTHRSMWEPPNIRILGGIVQSIVSGESDSTIKSFAVT